MNHQISLAAAVAMTEDYRANRNTILAQGYQQGDILANCETFEKASVAALLAQSGAGYLRIYYGMDENLKVHAILVAANAEGADILPEQENTTLETGGIILEDAQRCPPYCPPPSPLNDE